MINKQLQHYYNVYPKPYLAWLPLLVKKPRLIKYYHEWYKSTHNTATAIDDTQPWMVYEAIDWLKNYLRNDMKVFEWGSGGSTLFLSNKVDTIISVEHDKEWYDIVKKKLVDLKITNCQYNLIPAELNNIATISDDGLNYCSDDEHYKNQVFVQYSRAILSYADDSFDLIIVDGRARNACLFYTLKKLKPNGVLLLDNSERPIYQPGTDLYSDFYRKNFWGPGPYNSGFWQTSIFSKIKNLL